MTTIHNPRYHKQMLFSGIGQTGQQALRDSSVLLVGCGALGCVVADALTRAGVGRIRIVDRDFVELSNLQRQMLFDEQDVTEHLPKAIAAARRLRQINSDVIIDPVVADADCNSLPELASEASLLLDGTDNFEIRYLLNDLSLETGKPWIFTGCTGSHGQVMPVLPGRTACLRCLLPSPPPPGSVETCDTAGVLGPAVSVAAALQAALALKILAGHTAEITGQLSVIDVWTGAMRQVDTTALKNAATCPACCHGERLWLNGTHRAASTVLCGRNAVQITPPEPLQKTLPELARQLQNSGQITLNKFLLRLQLQTPEKDSDLRETGMELTIFPDGRAIIRGTSDPAVARSLYSRYIGG
ncbi:MAG: ThiF family adenylyltransferase [Planctomycetaceae bacterium]|jgi:adenylyltransferase/sulfurtransferase